jgi:hypothetical protein
LQEGLIEKLRAEARIDEDLEVIYWDNPIEIASVLIRSLETKMINSIEVEKALQPRCVGSRLGRARPASGQESHRSASSAPVSLRWSTGHRGPGWLHEVSHDGFRIRRQTGQGGAQYVSHVGARRITDLIAAFL